MGKLGRAAAAADAALSAEAPTGAVTDAADAAAVDAAWSGARAGALPFTGLSGPIGFTRADDSGLPPKLWLYSGHDITLLALQAALGLSVDAWPGFCAHLAIELLSGGRATESPGIPGLSPVPVELPLGKRAAAEETMNPSVPFTGRPSTPNRGAYYVRVLLNGDPVVLPGCPGACALAEFSASIAPFVLREDVHECLL